ncbi:MAG: squalene/phytoene synthase family protein [Alphaproteobacteria bacterium]|nr:squalene/phytoene synthase family protein [Alphaproteobacteria bacterium]
MRRQDPDRFAATMLAPGTLRPALWTLLAFNQEIAKTREVVSEPTIGLIRLQWWRDAVDEAFAGSPRRHQVVEPLAAVLREHGLERSKIDALIDAREQDFDASPFGDLDSIVAYARATNARLHDVLADLLGVAPDDGDTRDALSAGAIAWALAGIARAVPIAIGDGTVALPQTLLEEAGLSPQKIIDRPTDDRLKPVIRRLVDAAGKALVGAPAARDARAAPLLALNRLTRIHLDRLEAAGFDVFDGRVHAPIPFSGIRMAWAKFRKRY